MEFITDYSGFFFMLTAIVAFLIIVKLLNSVIKAAIVSFVIIIMFRIGWVYNSRDLKEKLWLDKIFDKEHLNVIYEKYDDFRNRDKENEVIDTEKIDEIIKEKIEDTLSEKVEKYINREKDPAN